MSTGQHSAKPRLSGSTHISSNTACLSSDLVAFPESGKNGGMKLFDCWLGKAIQFMFEFGKVV